MLLGLTPYLFYPDAGAALDWLARVFGFGESTRYVDEAGTVQEGEIDVGPATLMVAGRAPRPGEGAGQLLIVTVDDVDAHYRRAVAEGAEAQPPEDKPYGPRVYETTDPWDYRWSFWQTVSDFVDGTGGLRKVTA